jgi:hypothetical protein
MDIIWKTLTYSFRLLLKKPGFTLVAITAISLGIGANTAIFSVVNAVLLQPLPFDHPEQLVMLSTEARSQALDGRAPSPFPISSTFRLEPQRLNMLLLTSGQAPSSLKEESRNALLAPRSTPTISHCFVRNQYWGASSLAKRTSRAHRM